MGVLLAMLLAAAIDFGRAFYTAVVVTNMAGEGASFASIYPDQDAVVSNQTCSQLPVNANKTIQQRARMVAKDRGLVIEQQDQSSANIQVTTDGYGSTCSARCAGRTITVRVTYTLNDLFLPHLLGFNAIPITRSASQVITTNVFNGICTGN